MMQHNKLEILHLTKRFGEKTLFEDLNLTVEEPAVLWAPSGWGKTTLLRVLMGLETPTSGSVQGVGRVSAVFQEDRLCPQLNAVQNVALVLPGLETQYKEQIETCFQQLGLDSTALVLPARKLSGGQKRRVALLRALLAPCCWTSRSQGWIRRPCKKPPGSSGSEAAAKMSSSPPMTGTPSRRWAGR